MNAEQFRSELRDQISRAHRQGRPHVEVNAGELHRTIGGYPPKAGASHAMPLCCSIMWDEFREGHDTVVHRTESGAAPALTIRYQLPR